MTIDAGGGKNLVSVTSTGYLVTIEGGDIHTDLIEDVKINAGTDDDTILTYSCLSTLHIKNCNIDAVTANNKDIILKMGTDSVKLVNAACNVFKFREVDGTLTKRIYDTNGAEHSFYGEDDLAVYGNGGDDHIFSARFPVGAITSNVTINGGTGDDTINASANNVLVEYSDGDGNDVIHAFGSDDTLKISALSYTLERKGFQISKHRKSYWQYFCQ